MRPHSRDRGRSNRPFRRRGLAGRADFGGYAKVSVGRGGIGGACAPSDSAFAGLCKGLLIGRGGIGGACAPSDPAFAGLCNGLYGERGYEIPAYAGMTIGYARAPEREPRLARRDERERRRRRVGGRFLTLTPSALYPSNRGKTRRALSRTSLRLSSSARNSMESITGSISSEGRPVSGLRTPVPLPGDSVPKHI